MLCSIGLVFRYSSQSKIKRKEVLMSGTGSRFKSLNCVFEPRTI